MVEIRNFIGGMDLDSTLYDIVKGFYLDALNITKNDVSSNHDLSATNVTGNRKVAYSYPAGRGKYIGSFPFQLRNTVIGFRWNVNGFHGVYEYNHTTRVISKIFESRTDSDGIDVLNFTENGKITSVNVYPRDEGDLLFFLDSLGRPTEMDIQLFKAGAYTPVTRDIINTGKNPPLSPPSLVYDNDISTRSNYYYKKLIRGKYRFIYDDLTKSTFSPTSAVPLPVSILSDIYTNVITNNNVTRWVMNTGAKNVKSIEVAFSFVDASNIWSDFQSITVIDKSSLAFGATVQVIDAFLSFPYRVIISFTGTVLDGTAINIYATQLPSTQVLIGTYTTVLGDTISDVGAALVTSLNSIGIADFASFSSTQLIIHLDDALYTFDSIDITPSTNPVVDDIDISFAFYNESTYPDVDILQSIQLFDEIPDIANAQDMPNGNVLAFAGITEGYDKDTTEDAVITVDTVAAGNGGVVGNLSSVAGNIDFFLSFADCPTTFSGIPATGTIINLKVRRSSDHTVITGGTYTTVAGDTVNSIVSNFTITLPNASVSSRSGATIRITLTTNHYEELPSSSDWTLMEIIPPTTATATNSIATWPWSSSRNIGRVYFDKKGKTNGVLYTDKVTFPAYAENVSNVALLPFINYKISDVPPSWAYSFQFVFTKDGTDYKVWESMTVQLETEYIYFEVTSFTTNATKKPTTAQVCSYSFQDGDRLRLWRDTDSPGTVFSDAYDSAIEGLVNTPTINGVVTPTGSLFLKIKNVSPFTGVISAANNYVIAIYRPTQQAANPENKVYYELGRQYAVLDPTLSTRRHSGEVTDQVVGVTPAEFNFYQGDVYYRVRTIATTETGYATFNVIDKNFVDFYISAVNSIDGRPNLIDINAKRQYYGTLIRHSETYQADTNINGLNRFYESNFDEYPLTFGDVVRIKSRDKYLKVFQKFKIGVVPLYAQITKDPRGNNVLVVSDKLLNPIQYRIGNFGLSQGTSLASWHFADYGCDSNSGDIWRDSDDGVLSVSKLYNTDSWALVELPLRNGDDSFIYGAINPKTNEYIVALEPYITPVPFFSIDASGLNSINNSTGILITSANDFRVDWGDGTVDSFTAGTRSPTHIYTAPYTGVIKILTDELSGITSLEIAGTNVDINPVSDALAILTSEINKLTALTSLILGGSIYLNGIASDLPRTLTHIYTINNNLSGGVSDLPSGLTYINIQGSNRLSGTVSQLPSGLTTLILYGLNTLSGNVSGLPRTLTIVFVYGNNTLSGNVSGLPPSTLQVFILGFNTISGNVSGFPATVTNIIIVGLNTISGDVANLPSALVGITLQGNNTLSGDISDIPPLVTFFQVTGLNTLVGDLAMIPAGIVFINVSGSASGINSYSNGVRTWSSTMQAIQITPGVGGLSTTNVDNLLIELAAQVSTWVNYKVVSLQGANGARSAASNAAVTILNGLGVTVTTN